MVKSNAVIAVDDILVTPESCPPNGSCSFESGFCSWQQRHSPLQWIRMSALIPTRYVGPGYDVTTDSPQGWYIVVEGEKRNKNTRAILDSEKFDATDRTCLEFYYFIKGSGRCKLLRFFSFAVCFKCVNTDIVVVLRI